MRKNPYLRFSGMALQMAVIIGGAAWAGVELDKYVGNDSQLWTIVLILVGLGAALYLFIKQALKMGKDED